MERSSRKWQSGELSMERRVINGGSGAGRRMPQGGLYCKKYIKLTKKFVKRHKILLTFPPKRISITLYLRKEKNISVIYYFNRSTAR